MQDSTFMSFMRKMQHENAARVDIRDESAQGLSGSLGCYKSLVYVSNKVLPFVTVRVCVCVHLHRALTPLRLRAQQLQTAETAITSTASLSLSFSPCHTYTPPPRSITNSKSLGPQGFLYPTRSQQVNTITFIYPYTQTRTHTQPHKGIHSSTTVLQKYPRTHISIQACADTQTESPKEDLDRMGNHCYFFPH